MPWLWFSCLALLFLLPPVSFAESHLWQYRPFRANDTDHSGGDHICDLRRDSNADGKPDRLGEYVTVSGSVILAPSTFEPAGRLFGVRGGGCALLVYGAPENLSLGDSVVVRGRVRLSGRDFRFLETEDVGLGDIALEKGAVTVCSGTGDTSPVPVSPGDYAARPEDYAGNLVSLTGPVYMMRAFGAGQDGFILASCAGDSLVFYVDADAGCRIGAGRCYTITGVVLGLAMLSGAPSLQLWCIAPRDPDDVVEVGCAAACESLPWGYLKLRYWR